MIRHAEENGHENQLWGFLNKESHAASCLHRSEAPRRALSLDGVQQLPPNCCDVTAEKGWHRHGDRRGDGCGEGNEVRMLTRVEIDGSLSLIADK
jgi:hypothetical protein